MNSELIRIWNKAVVACLECLRKTVKTLNQEQLMLFILQIEKIICASIIQVNTVN
jgi:hypothetical protein